MFAPFLFLEKPSDEVIEAKADANQRCNSQDYERGDDNLKSQIPLLVRR